MPAPVTRHALALAAAALLTAGCGSSSRSSAGAGATGASPASGAASSTTAATPAGGAALSADATSAATGDIPDNQNFLTFSDPGLRVSIVYPEGWAEQHAAGTITFRDKNNLVRIGIARGSAPSSAQVSAALAALRRSEPTLTAGAPASITLKSGPALKVTYTTLSAPNPVTGKRVKLTVDRYVLSHAGRVATVDLGTPVGVDNVDAYRMMINSFRWR